MGRCAGPARPARRCGRRPGRRRVRWSRARRRPWARVSGATSRLLSRSSRSRRDWTISSVTCWPSWSARRRARSSAEAVRNTLRSASGSTTVPMSRPSTTPPRCAAARCSGVMASRTDGRADTRDTPAVTASPRISSSTSSSSSHVRPPVRASWTDRATSPHAASSSRSTSARRQARVTARYSAPVSTCGTARVSASSRATVDLPDPAGPSIATMGPRPASTVSLMMSPAGRRRGRRGR